MSVNYASDSIPKTKDTGRNRKRSLHSKSLLGFKGNEGFPGDSDVKNLSAMQQTWFHPLGQEDHLEKGMATHSSILAWRIPWAEEPGGLQSMGLQRVRHD